MTFDTVELVVIEVGNFNLPNIALFWKIGASSWKSSLIIIFPLWSDVLEGILNWSKISFPQVADGINMRDIGISAILSKKTKTISGSLSFSNILAKFKFFKKSFE